MDIQPQLPLSESRIIADKIALSCWGLKSPFLLATTTVKQSSDQIYSVEILALNDSLETIRNRKRHHSDFHSALGMMLVCQSSIARIAIRS